MPLPRRSKPQPPTSARPASPVSFNPLPSPTATFLPARRRDVFTRLASTLTLSHDLSSDGPPSPVYHSPIPVFEHALLSSIDTTEPLRSSAFFKHRVPGTLSEIDSLPCGVEDVRRRQEHVERLMISMPVLFNDCCRGPFSGVEETFLAELRDLYTIVGSMIVRKWDLGRSDVRALFEWWRWFEKLIRVYFAATERLSGGAFGGEKRRKEKRRVVELLEGVERMKRRMLAGRSSDLVEELEGKIGEMSMAVMGCFRRERDELAGRGDDVQDTLLSIVKELGGKECVGLLARGGVNMEIAGRRWLWSVVDRHVGYVRMFERVEREYRNFYKKLGKEVDLELRGLSSGDRK